MIQRFKRLILLTILTPLLSISAAEMPQAFTLEQAEEYALKNSRDLALQQIEVNKAKIKVKESLSYLLPQVNGELSYTHYGKLMTTIIPAGLMGFPEMELQFGLPENVNAQISATQTLFNGVFLVGFKAADIFVKMTQQEKVVKETDLKNLIANSYYNVLVARESMATIEKNIANLEKLLQETQNLYNNGLVEEIDVDRLSLALSNLKSQINTLQNNSELTEVVLKFQMGYPVDDSIELTQTLSDFIQEDEFKLYPQEATFKNRPELMLMNLREQVNLANIKRLKFSNLPSLTAFANVASSAQRTKFDFFNFGKDKHWYNVRYFGIQLNVPIWDSFGRRSQVNGAREDLERIRIGRDQLEESFKVEYYKAKTSYANALNEYNQTVGSLKLAQKIYDTAQMKYKSGVGSSLEMTNAQQELYSTQAKLINAKYRVLTAKTEVEKALGNN